MAKRVVRVAYEIQRDIHHILRLLGAEVITYGPYDLFADNQYCIVKGNRIPEGKGDLLITVTEVRHDDGSVSQTFKFQNTEVETRLPS